MIRLVNWTRGGVAVFAGSEQATLSTGLSDADIRLLSARAAAHAEFNHKLPKCHE